MTSKMFINRKGHYANSLKSYWWLALINAIYFCLIGPVAFTMIMGNYQRGGYDSSNGCREWFEGTGFLLFYVSVVLTAVVMGLVVFNYLHHKRQVNFYHSQPITRGNLFAERYVLGIILAVVPMLVMLLLEVALAGFYGQDMGYALVQSVRHFGRLLLFYLLSYSLTVAAGQLTGTGLTHFFMTLVMHFGLTMLYICRYIVSSVFFNTFYTGSDLWEKALSLSPLGYVGMHMEGYNAANGLSGSAALVITVLIIACTLGGYLLYRRRPSEASGQSVVYAWLGWPLKVMMMVVAAVVGGYMFLEISGLGFMVFGAIVGMVLTHMAAEVILNRDFKAILRNMKGCALIVLLCLAGGATLYYDVWGYDRYLPKAEDVAQVRFGMSNMAEGWPSYNFEKSAPYTGEKQITNIVAIVDRVVTAGAYAKISDDLESKSRPPSEVASNIYVEYTLKNGRQVLRQYQATPVALYQEEFAELYNSEEYKQVNFLDVLENVPLLQTREGAFRSDHISEISISSVYATEGARSGTTLKSQYLTNFYERPAEKAAYSERIIAAAQEDIRARQWSTLTQGAIYKIDIQWYEAIPKTGNDSGYWHQLPIAVYPDDRHMLAVIGELAQKEEIYAMTPENMAEIIDTMELYRVNTEALEEAYSVDAASDIRPADIRSSIQNALLFASPKDRDAYFTPLRQISDKGTIAAMLMDLVSAAQLYESSAFVQLDYTYVVKARLNSDALTEGRDDGTEDWVFYFLRDHQPME